MVTSGSEVDSLGAGADLSSEADSLVSDVVDLGFGLVSAVCVPDDFLVPSEDFEAVDELFFEVPVEDSSKSGFLAAVDCFVEDADVEELFVVEEPFSEDELFVEDAVFPEDPLFVPEDPVPDFLTAGFEVTLSDFFSAGALHKAVAVSHARTSRVARKNETTDILVWGLSYNSFPVAAVGGKM